jgi:hypothetical protein
VVLGGLFGMVFGMQMMAMRDVGMVGGLFMIAGFMMLGGFSVVLAGFFVVLGGLLVMFNNGVCHFQFPLLGGFSACRQSGNHLEANGKDVTA